MKKIPLTIKGLSYSERQTGAYALILAEENGVRKLPIVIGGFEAQAIAIALEKMVSPPRPLTHDLFRDFANVFDIGLEEIIIYKIKDGVFFANLHCKKGDKQEVIDARPSDAVALAIRFQCPIFTTEEVLQSAGLILQEENEETEKPAPKESSLSSKVEEKKESKSESPLKSTSLKKLNQMLEKAVKDEYYELAARIRDEIDRRET